MINRFWWIACRITAMQVSLRVKKKLCNVILGHTSAVSLQKTLASVFLPPRPYHCRTPRNRSHGIVLVGLFSWSTVWERFTGVVLDGRTFPFGLFSGLSWRSLHSAVPSYPVSTAHQEAFPSWVHFTPLHYSHLVSREKNRRNPFICEKHGYELEKIYNDKIKGI